MNWQAVIIVLILAIAAVVIGLPALRRFQAPNAGTERLAITVWAAFGPYETAQDAEDGLRRAGRAVLGSNGLDQHGEWMQGHVRNFKVWEAEGRFVAAHNFMRKRLLLTFAFEQKFTPWQRLSPNWQRLLRF